MRSNYVRPLHVQYRHRLYAFELGFTQLLSPSTSGLIMPRLFEDDLHGSEVEVSVNFDEVCPMNITT